MDFIARAITPGRVFERQITYLDELKNSSDSDEMRMLISCRQLLPITTVRALQLGFLEWHEHGGMEAIVSSVLAGYVEGYTSKNKLCYPHWGLINNDLVNHWMLAIYFDLPDIEQLYREKIRFYLDDKDDEVSCFAVDDYYVSENVTFIRNLLASMDAGKLTLAYSNTWYDNFFDLDKLPKDPIKEIHKVHLQRATYKGKGYEPLEGIPRCVFPIENLAWYRLASKEAELTLGDCLTSRFIRTPFTNVINYPEFVNVIAKASEACDFDFVEYALGSEYIDYSVVDG
uniref:hypothetical protein n=1 Tax=Thaumasiovibrio occultus TaxID=1891184 RepID=UPI00131EB953|nr:hypothetical protein [Thaumasiovibrio occultus]